jgi:hypothetical protein
MSEIRVTVGIRCDYARCTARSNDISSEFSPVPLAAGWQRWVGRRRTMDYCPEHAARPKSPGMRKIWPAP